MFYPFKTKRKKRDSKSDETRLYFSQLGQDGHDNNGTCNMSWPVLFSVLFFRTKKGGWQWENAMYSTGLTGEIISDKLDKSALATFPGVGPPFLREKYAKLSRIFTNIPCNLQAHFHFHNPSHSPLHIAVHCYLTFIFAFT